MGFYDNTLYANAWSNNPAVGNEVVNNFLPNSLDDQIDGAAEKPMFIPPSLPTDPISLSNIPLPPPLDFEAPLTFRIPTTDPSDPSLLPALYVSSILSV